MNFRNRIMVKLLLYVSVLIFVAGCSNSIAVKKEGRDNWNNYFETSFSKNSLNQSSRNFLADHILTQEYDDNDLHLIEKAQEIIRKSPESQSMLILADISFHMAMRNYNDENIAIKFFLYSAISSYAYISDDLFKVEDMNSQSTIQYRQTQAIDIYNLSISEIFTYMNKNNLWGKEFSLQTIGGQTIKFPATIFKTTVKPEEVESIKLSANYTTKNINHISRTRGIGAPVTLQLKPMQQSSANNLNYAPNQNMPATYMITLKSLENKTYEATPIILDSLTYHEIQLGKNIVDLEQDLTVPLAFMASNPLKYNFVYYMLFPGKTTDAQGLYMFEPMNENKIPVIFVHGLLSNARTWLQMVNTLRNDKRIRDRYQFWGYTYSSGNPIILSAKQFQHRLNEVRSTLITNGYDVTNFDKMILVGHSMGGLLCKTTAINDKNTNLKEVLLDNQESKDIYETLSKKQQEEIDKLISLNSLEFVKRIIFIATPHRGADMANGWVGLIGSALIELPQTIVIQGLTLGSALRENGYYLPKTAGFKTGIQNLSPEDKFLASLNKISLSEDKKYHSIIGDNKQANSTDGTDGIVKYSSSHIDEAESELVVKSSHSAQQNPLAIQELKRILLLNIAEETKLTREDK